MKRLVLSLVCALAFLGCSADAGLGDEGDGPVAEEIRAADDRADIPFRVIDGFRLPSDVGTTAARRVFRSESAFRAYFGVRPPAGVNFARDWVAFYSAGVQRTGGYTAAVTSIRLSNTGLTLKVTTRLESPGEHCRVTDALTKPFALVAFTAPRYDAERTQFLRDDATVDCAPPFTPCMAARCSAGYECDDSSGRAVCVPNRECLVGATDQCPAGYFCASAAASCGGTGACAARPEVCNRLYLPVCGCDGETYGNACSARANGVNVASEGACDAPTSCAVVLCGPDTVCDDASGRAVCVPIRTCSNWGETCDAGTHCEEQAVTCVRAPCPAIPACVANVCPRPGTAINCLPGPGPRNPLCEANYRAWIVARCRGVTFAF